MVFNVGPSKANHGEPPGLPDAMTSSEERTSAETEGSRLYCTEKATDGLNQGGTKAMHQCPRAEFPELD